MKSLSVMIWVACGIFLMALSAGRMATAQTFDESAHGNNAYGVNRDSVSQPTGDCTHCHDASDSPNCGVYAFSLFYDDAKEECDLFCFTCHGQGLASQQVENYLYSITFGGYPPVTYGSIWTQFCDAQSTYENCGSKHSLLQIYNYLKSGALPSWNSNPDPDPCVACHDPHTVQRNYPPVIDGEGKLNSALRRPGDYRGTRPYWALWGDDENERMDYYAQMWFGVYQAPYYYYGQDAPGSQGYEPGPAGSTIQDGSNTPDYNRVCWQQCHWEEQYDPERGAVVKPINWNNFGDVHGQRPRDLCSGAPPFEEGDLKAPYTDPDANYILSCLDCHEPHGTPNRPHLIRRVINGQLLDPDSVPCDQDPDWVEICEKCHDWPHSNWGGCEVCHYNATYGGFHGSEFNVGTNDCTGSPAF